MAQRPALAWPEPPAVVDTYTEPQDCELTWLQQQQQHEAGASDGGGGSQVPSGSEERQCGIVKAAAIAAGYRPWCEGTDRPLLDPPQDPAVANAKYVFTVTKALGSTSTGKASKEKEISPGSISMLEADATAVRNALSYPDASGDTAIWMLMATRPIRQHEEILVEKYQQLESGVGHDGSRTTSIAAISNSYASPGAVTGSPGDLSPHGPKIKRPRSTKRSAGVQQTDAAEKWASLRHSLDQCTDDDAAVAWAERRYVIPPPLHVTVPHAHTTAAAGTGASGEGYQGIVGQGQHRPWGGVFDYSAYAANSNSGLATGSSDDGAVIAAPAVADAVVPFRKAGGDGSRLSRAEGVAAVRNACVLGKGVYISPSVVRGAGNGLYCDLSVGFDRGDVMTVYDGIVDTVGALLYDPAQQAFFNPKLVSEHTDPNNPRWRFGNAGNGTDAAVAAAAGSAAAAGATGAAAGSGAAVGAGAVGGSKGFQSHWKDAGASPGGTSVIMGFGGWPVPFAPCGLGAGAMVNAVYGCKGRVGRDPEALARRRAERARREELGLVVTKPVGSKLACSLGWGNMGRKRRGKKKKTVEAAAVEVADDGADDDIVLGTQ